MNVYDYFHATLGGDGVDTSLQALPVSSECGQACVRVICAAKLLLGATDPSLHIEIIRAAHAAVLIHWRG